MGFNLRVMIASGFLFSGAGIKGYYMVPKFCFGTAK